MLIVFSKKKKTIKITKFTIFTLEGIDRPMIEDHAYETVRQ